MYDEGNLNELEVEVLLNTEEGHFVDNKSTRSIPKIAKTLSAFANADGGDLFVGIEDKSELERLAYLYEDPEAANGLVAVVSNMFADGLEYISGKFLRVPNAGLVLWYSVRKTPFVVQTPNGEVFRRENAQDRKVSGRQELVRLELDKGVRSAEERRTEATVGELPDSSIARLFVENTVPAMDIRAYVARERLVADEEYLRMAAALLFLDYPQPLIPSASVKIYRYRSVTEEGERNDLASDPITIEGPIYEIIRQSVLKTKRLIEEIPILLSGGLDEIKYPDEAVHEVISNAVLHRDYSISDYVHIRIFDNRVEVESPGKLAGQVTIENIRGSRFARNKQITRLTAKFPDPPNKDVGEGLNTTFQAMRALNLKPPVIKETETSVIVRLAHEPLASKEELIISFLKKNGTINNTQAREFTNEPSDSIIRKMFARMMKVGEIERVPETKGKGTKYRLPNAD